MTSTTTLAVLWSALALILASYMEAGHEDQRPIMEEYSVLQGRRLMKTNRVDELRRIYCDPNHHYWPDSRDVAYSGDEDPQHFCIFPCSHRSPYSPGVGHDKPPN
ncbi:hypothetical protein TIFTF001_024255 [Ficus carica]|uniref:Uncharacterized protein n=1 Tax=Ficus carica TaxID=3494 RepID=A0AA88DD69_FICCA|nr:hypothetical protein TIFTF001_024255 [Ficus carica]